MQAQLQQSMDGIHPAMMSKMGCAWATTPCWPSWPEISRVNLYTEDRTPYLARWIVLDLWERLRQRPPQATEESQPNCEPQRQYSSPIDQPGRAASAVTGAGHTRFLVESVQ